VTTFDLKHSCVGFHPSGQPCWIPEHGKWRLIELPKVASVTLLENTERSQFFH